MTKSERTTSKSSHLSPRNSSRVSTVGSLSSSLEELVSRKKDAGEGPKASVRDRTSMGKGKVGVSSGGRVGRPRSGSQESAHSVTSLRLSSKSKTASKVNLSTSAKSGVVGKVSKTSREALKSNSKGMKEAVSIESLPKMESGMVVSAGVVSSHNSTASSPYSECRYSHLPISDSSESENEVSMSSQLGRKLSLPGSSFQSLTQEVVTASTAETGPENPSPESLVLENPIPENLVPVNLVPVNPIPVKLVTENHVPVNPVPVNPIPENPIPESPVPENPIPENHVQKMEPQVHVPTSQEDSKMAPDLPELLAHSQQPPDLPLPVQTRSESFEQESSEILSCQIQNSSVIFKTLASRLHNWKMLGRYLMLEDEEINRISAEYTFTSEQAYQMLRTWMGKDPSTATYAVLIESLHNSLREDLVMEVLQAAKVSQKGLIVQVSENGGAVAFNADLSRLWQTMQPFVDRCTKEGYSHVEVNLRFRK